jgi:large subunit ribosomal protein L38e
MPKQISDIREFIKRARGDDKFKTSARSVTIKKTGPITKFKLRCSKYLYTLKIDDAKKADKLK